MLISSLLFLCHLLLILVLHAAKVLMPPTLRICQASSKLTFSSSFNQGKHRLHIPLYMVSLYNFYFMFLGVHLHIGVLWNLVALQTPLTSHLVFPYERIDDDSVLCLVM
jgi:hypothetical protein